MSYLTFAAARLLDVLPRERISSAVGRVSEQRLPSSVSRTLIKAYAAAFGADLEEAADGHFASFDAFFTRRLREPRPIAEAKVVCPADGQLQSAGAVGRCITVKGRSYALADLLEDAAPADVFENGSFAVIYLSPGDYHRVHCPADGSLVAVHQLPGDLYPVNVIGERHVPRLLVRNRRVVLSLETTSVGRMAVVMVGAVLVGRISVNAVSGGADDSRRRIELSPALDVRRGDELGVFHLGSSVVVLTEAELAVQGRHGRVRYGEPLMGAA